MKKKTIALLMAVVMLFGVTVGGTLAWLIAQSAKVENTFTFGDVNIILNEAPVDKDGVATSGSRRNENEYDLIPGQKAFKDPKVTVEANSEDCYVFVTVKETNNFYNGDSEKNIPGLNGRVIDFTINTTNWKFVKSENGADIYVYGAPTKVIKSTQDKMLESIIKDDEITVNDNLTKAQIADIKEDGKPVLEFNAYAIQADNLGTTDAAAIWDMIN